MNWHRPASNDRRSLFINVSGVVHSPRFRSGFFASLPLTPSKSPLLFLVALGFFAALFSGVA